MFSRLRNWFPWGEGDSLLCCPVCFLQAALLIDPEQSCLNILCFEFQEVTAFLGRGRIGNIGEDWMHNFLQQQRPFQWRWMWSFLARDVKSGASPLPPSPADEKCQSWEAEPGPPAMADGDGLDRKIGKYAEYFSVMGAAWPKVPRDLGRVPCNQLSIWSRSPC